MQTSDRPISPSALAVASTVVDQSIELIKRITFLRRTLNIARHVMSHNQVIISLNKVTPVMLVIMDELAHKPHKWDRLVEKKIKIHMNISFLFYRILATFTFRSLIRQGGPPLIMARASSRRNMSRTWSVGDNIGASNEIIDRRSAQNAIDLQTAAVLARLQLSPIASAPRQLSPLSVPRDARLPSSPSSAASPLMPLRNADLTAVVRYRVKPRDMRPSNGTAAAAKAIEQQATEHQLARRASNELATAALAATPKNKGGKGGKKGRKIAVEPVSDTGPKFADVRRDSLRGKCDVDK